MSDLVKFQIPAAFVVERTGLTSDEIVYGFEHGWLTSADVVKVALAGYNTFDEVPSIYEELALLLSDDLDRIPELVGLLVENCGEDAAKVWLFLALAWVYEHRDSYADPLEVVEMLYADFGYPSEIQRFVRFVPPSEGDNTGVEALLDRWQEYLTRAAYEYGCRLVE